MIVLILLVNLFLSFPIISEIVSLFTFFVSTLMLLIGGLKFEVDNATQMKENVESQIFFYRHGQAYWVELVGVSLIYDFDGDWPWSPYFRIIGIFLIIAIIVRFVFHYKYGLYFLQILILKLLTNEVLPANSELNMSK